MIYDLTMPMETGHFRWPLERKRNGDFAVGDVFEVTSFGVSCHAFTHLDAPCHMVPGGLTTDALELSNVMGQAAVINLSDIAPNEEITARHLDRAAAHLRPGQIALFRTCWDTQRDWRRSEYWRDAPYLSAEACHWLRERNPTSVAFDFPQDHTIRRVLAGEMPPIEEHVSHDILLRNGITLIEYLTGTMQLSEETVQFAALPLKLPTSDGAPARVVAWAG
ncbi:cyclase family protein [Roseobacter sp. YSTF-M11]|uniref:Cyclase family protein n=1 Tax=Roseobacter insulae TaxID=2859783 RepID=A0A9X1FYL2_9RHOB|nr:cyclase family protein [Roseobacter insulae]MBW4709742.1 cyclase family protein [Roseobacter insulae]